MSIGVQTSNDAHLQGSWIRNWRSIVVPIAQDGGLAADGNTNVRGRRFRIENDQGYTALPRRESVWFKLVCLGEL
jgi:hypothetical protein